MIKTWSAYSSALLLCLGLDVSTFADDSASASAEKQVAGIMAMDEQKLIALVPDQCPDIGVPCPKCKSHMRDMKAKWLWRVDEPNQVKCSKCDTIVPNIDYPMDKTCTYLNIRGERITVPYYHGPKPSGDLRGNPHPERYHFDGAIDNAHFGFTSRAVKDLANAYSLTKKDKYAHKALLILHEYSKKYPHYLCHRGRGINNYYVDVTRGCLVDGRLVNTGEDAPYGWTDTRMKKWWAAELDRDLWGSYRQVRSSPAADALSRELGTDVRRSIDGMIREMVDFIMLIPWGQPRQGYAALRTQYLHAGGICRAQWQVQPVSRQHGLRQRRTRQSRSRTRAAQRESLSFAARLRTRRARRRRRSPASTGPTPFLE